MNLNAIVNSELATLVPEKRRWTVINQTWQTQFIPDMCQPEYWLAKDLVVGQAQGRGTTYFVEHNEQQWVLRHYYRGGLVGKFINDSYFFSGLESTRAIREFSLLLKLKELGLPAPTPVACQITRHGLWYRGDIITTRIENAQDLFAKLVHTPCNQGMWHEIGRCIAAFHNAQVYHHDLNIHNILIDDEDKVWLIDFDQGAIKSGSDFKQGNLDRLKRSFTKELSTHPQLHWSEQEWQMLIDGYKKASI
ncbi:3-deoxy-D-manno-octulosonic acid kinase [Thalassotalea euphylliae]|uniref:3-deoxy-D-manno-octulosonic acid kinase n=1 Tax=Thalassotalea euphylliae TaxID=1655234 RepID=UPI003645C41A